MVAARALAEKQRKLEQVKESHYIWKPLKMSDVMEIPRITFILTIMAYSKKIKIDRDMPIDNWPYVKNSRMPIVNGGKSQIQIREIEKIMTIVDIIMEIAVEVEVNIQEMIDIEDELLLFKLMSWKQPFLNINI